VCVCTDQRLRVRDKATATWFYEWKSRREQQKHKPLRARSSSPTHNSSPPFIRVHDNTHTHNTLPRQRQRAFSVMEVRETQGRRELGFDGGDASGTIPESCLLLLLLLLCVLFIGTCFSDGGGASGTIPERVCVVYWYLRVCVLFIGTCFSNLYTAVDTPA
jgi:hypothetical protein